MFLTERNFSPNTLESDLNLARSYTLVPDCPAYVYCPVLCTLVGQSPVCVSGLHHVTLHVSNRHARFIHVVPCVASAVEFP